MRGQYEKARRCGQYIAGADLESILTVAHKGVVGNIIRDHTRSFKDIHPPSHLNSRRAH